MFTMVVQNCVNVLLVEDNDGDARLIKEAFKECHVEHLKLAHVSRLSEALDRMESFGIEVVILDLGLPDSQGIETLIRVSQAGHGVPIIVLTGRDDQAMALEAVRNGADDYLVKGQVDGHALVRSIRYSIERRLFRVALKESEDRYRLMIETAEEGVWLLDAHETTTFANAKMARILGYSLHEMMGRGFWQFKDPADQPRARTALAQLREGISVQGDFRFLRKDGSYVWTLCSIKPMTRQDSVYEGALAMVTDITERKRTEETLRTSEARLASAQKIAHLGSWDWNLATNTLFWSDEVYEILGLPKTQVPTYKVFLNSVHPQDRALVEKAVEGSLLGRPYAIDHRITLPDGHVRTVSVRAEVALDEHGKAKFTGTLMNITESAVLAEELRQAQKMEAVGRLAGGVAHDFNNLLTVMIGYSQLVCDALPLENPLRENVEEVIKAGTRAASLTRQLLAFSRKQILAPRVMNLNTIVTDMDKFLRRLLEERIKLATRLAPVLCPVRVDPGQMEQIVMNLSINARDAMPGGGRLTLETSNVTLDEEGARTLHGAKAGTYVLLAVSDTGTGMTKETLSHLFEPFFTTKEVGKGTGLGLATVYGIVKQSGGYVTASSELSQGSTFKVYLPCVNEPITAPDSTRPLKSVRGEETILLVEDEESVRALTKKILVSHGYRVLASANAYEALAKAAEFKGKFDLLLTDVIMPGMSGRDLARKLLPREPSLKVLFVSGYADASVHSQDLIEQGTELIQKPFTAIDILARVRRILDS